MNDVMDKIYIRDLLCRCIVGIYPDERENKQDVIINIEMACDLSKAAASDDIDDTINYKSVKKEIMALVESSSFLLIERMAGEIASLCLAHEGVRQVRVTVDKPGALRFARSVAVEIVRTRPDRHG